MKKATHSGSRKTRTKRARGKPVEKKEPGRRGRPPTFDSGAMTRVTIRVPKELVAKLWATARKNRCDLAEVLRAALLKASGVA